MRTHLLLALALAGAWLTLGAQRSITGQITDLNGTSLSGVEITVKSTTVGTSTNHQGRYVLDVWSGAKSLIFSHPDYAPTERPIGSSDTIDVKLLAREADTTPAYQGPMDSLQTTFWATQVDLLTAADIRAAPYIRLDQLLQGRMPGLHIMQYAAQAASPGQIRHRGAFSASSASTPLLLIDGVRVDNLHQTAALGLTNISALADLPLEAIEQIAFVPATAAGTLYGSQAAGGLIDIRTRKGKQTAGPRFSYQAAAGILQPENRFLHFPNTQDLLYETGQLQLHRFTGSGHSEQTAYSFAASYYADDGTRAADEQERISLRMGFSAALRTNIDYSGSAAYQSAQYQYGYQGNNTLNPLALAESGHWGELADYTESAFEALRTAINQQYAATDFSARTQRFHMAHGLQWRPAKSITATLRMGLDQGQIQETEVFSNALAIAAGLESPGTLDQGKLQLADRQFSLFSNELLLWHETTLGELNLRSSIGGQYSQQTEYQSQTQALDLREGYSDLNHTSEQHTMDYRSALRYGGIFISEQLNLRNRLLGDAALRWEAHNAYGGLAEASPIYRLGLTYVLKQASPQTKVSTLSNFRLRASAGQALNYPLRYSQQSTLSPYGLLPEVFRAQTSPDSLALKPEKSTTYELGFSGSFFQEYLQLGFTYYTQKTTDAILPVPAATSAEAYGLLRNAGAISNTGTELRLRLHLARNTHFSLAIHGSWIHNQNKVEDLADNSAYALAGLGLAHAYVQANQPLGYWQGSIPIIAANGELTDYEADQYLGDPNPDGYGVVGLDIRWKRWSLFVNGDYQYGAQGVDAMAALRYLNGLTADDIAPIDGLPLEQLGQLWIADTDMLKIRQIGLNYRVEMPQNLVRQLELGLMLRQPFSWTSSNFDPEASTIGQGRQGSLHVPGISLGGESLPRQLVFHARATF